jgi:hypothetical protein
VSVFVDDRIGHHRVRPFSVRTRESQRSTERYAISSCVTLEAHDGLGFERWQQFAVTTSNDLAGIEVGMRVVYPDVLRVTVDSGDDCSQFADRDAQCWNVVAMNGFHGRILCTAAP